jgi:transcription elongation factor Elf1
MKSPNQKAHAFLAPPRSAPVTCPACNAQQMRSACLLGTLGILSWFRCRYCGSEWSRKGRRRNR